MCNKFAYCVFFTGYNKWREYCGLQPYDSFTGMLDIPVEVREKLANIYE